VEAEQLRKYYQALRAVAAWQTVLADLRQYAMQEPETAVRCGRLEMVNHIDEMLAEEPS
jgi:hypothetical protein